MSNSLIEQMDRQRLSVRAADYARVMSPLTESPITNSPRIKNGLIRAIRGMFEHRATWLYLLVDEARKAGVESDRFARQAVTRCGHFHGKQLVEKGGTTSLKGLRKTLFTKPARWVFEIKIPRSTDDNLDVDFHYCPLVSAWQKQGATPEQIAQLCDIAMEGDRGIAANYGSEVEVLSAISRGDDYCQVRFLKKQPAA